MSDLLSDKLREYANWLETNMEVPASMPDDLRAAAKELDAFRKMMFDAKF